MVTEKESVSRMIHLLHCDWNCEKWSTCYLGNESAKMATEHLRHGQKEKQKFRFHVFNPNRDHKHELRVNWHENSTTEKQTNEQFSYIWDKASILYREYLWQYNFLVPRDFFVLPQISRQECGKCRFLREKNLAAYHDMFQLTNESKPCTGSTSLNGNQPTEDCGFAGKQMLKKRSNVQDTCSNIQNSY